MTKFLLIFIFSTLSALYSFGQLAIDYDCQKEVSEIILNYKNYGIEKFDIKYKQRFNQQRANKDIFRYRFINDTTLEHKYKKSSSLYKFESGVFEAIIDARDSLWHEEYKKDKIFITKDSAGYNIHLIYLKKEEDTLLISEYMVKQDDELKIEISKFLSDTNWNIQKIETTYLSDSSKRVQSSIYRDHQWFKFFDYLEVTTHDENENIVTMQITQYAGGYENSEKIIHETIRTRKAVYHYDKIGIIEKVEIIEVDNSSKDITILTPIRKR